MNVNSVVYKKDIADRGIIEIRKQRFIVSTRIIYCFQNALIIWLYGYSLDRDIAGELEVLILDQRLNQILCFLPS